MTTRFKINWSPEEEKILSLSINHYGKKNWYKIISNFHYKNIEQIKTRWKGWNQHIINKKIWSLTEDLKLYNQLKWNYGVLEQKLNCKNRSNLQCFFRGVIILELKIIKKKKYLKKIDLLFLIQNKTKNHYKKQKWKN